ncbi:Uncharacterised protein [Providencia rustigianii]|uniref:Transposase n=1 Tax=Providencia rustigianii TaxID=158850 RepID=A0A379G775_9GAMM|nr:Uncharacterised protein [Providencia rustigianii]VEB75353.1 Uncharacterised protein [Providencia rustigianii]
MSGKRYPEEFKVETVKQIIDRGYSINGINDASMNYYTL